MKFLRPFPTIWKISKNDLKNDQKFSDHLKKILKTTYKTTKKCQKRPVKRPKSVKNCWKDLKFDKIQKRPDLEAKTTSDLLQKVPTEIFVKTTTLVVSNHFWQHWFLAIYPQLANCQCQNIFLLFVKKSWKYKSWLQVIIFLYVFNLLNSK